MYVAACVLGIYVLSIIFSGQGNSNEDSSVMRNFMDEIFYLYACLDSITSNVLRKKHVV